MVTTYVRKNKPPGCAPRPPIERFLAKVMHDGVTTCWHWSGSANPHYGSFAVDASKAHAKRVGAHRFAYETFVGAIPDGKEIDHICRNKLCVNPAHLRAVTRQENLAAIPPQAYQWMRKPVKRRPKSHCKRGHDLALHGKVVTENGGRECKLCRPLIYRRQRARKGIPARRFIDEQTKTLIRAAVASGEHYQTIAKRLGISTASVCRSIRGRK